MGILKKFIKSASIEYELQIILSYFGGFLQLPCKKKIDTPQGKNFAALSKN